MASGLDKELLKKGKYSDFQKKEKRMEYADYKPDNLTLIPRSILECLLKGLVNEHLEREAVITMCSRIALSKTGQARLI